MPLSYWKRVIFSDESKFELISNKRRAFCWRLSYQAYNMGMVLGRVKHSKSVMVWGCMSWYGPGVLVPIRGNMTSAMYIDIINDNIIRSATGMGIQNDFIFQQDNDPKHTANATKEYFLEVGLEVLEWVSYSPDMNWI